mmetsp:Transcript_29318/g.79363  ORF Transcript_29318/g.79363 Transcript_29318/m.79363 type:complete len:263 (-) Transcript_29318:506-1294(-)
MCRRRMRCVQCNDFQARRGIRGTETHCGQRLPHAGPGCGRLPHHHRGRDRQCEGGQSPPHSAGHGGTARLAVWILHPRNRGGDLCAVCQQVQHKRNRGTHGRESLSLHGVSSHLGRRPIPLRRCRGPGSWSVWDGVPGVSGAGGVRAGLQRPRQGNGSGRSSPCHRHVLEGQNGNQRVPHVVVTRLGRSTPSDVPIGAFRCFLRRQHGTVEATDGGRHYRVPRCRDVDQAHDTGGTSKALERIRGSCRRRLQDCCGQHRSRH